MTTDTDYRHGLYVAHRPALIRYATRISGSRDAAEDIVQDAWLRFAPAATKADNARQALAYLYRIVRNLAFDVMKHRRVELREQQTGDPPFWSIPPEVRTPEEELLLQDDMRQAALVLDSLAPEIRIAVEMHRFDGYTLEEVASHLDISVATAHRYVKGALLRIAMRLGEPEA